MGIITAKTAEPIDMPFPARIVPHNHVLHGGPDPPQEKGNFGGGQTWACAVSLHWGMDLWADDAAFYRIPSTFCSFSVFHIKRKEKLLLLIRIHESQIQH